MQDKEKMKIIKAVLSDHYKVILSESVTLIIINNIVNPPEISASDIEWANKALKKFYKEYL